MRRSIISFTTSFSIYYCHNWLFAACYSSKSVALFYFIRKKLILFSFHTIEIFFALGSNLTACQYVVAFYFDQFIMRTQKNAYIKLYLTYSQPLQQIQIQSSYTCSISRILKSKWLVDIQLLFVIKTRAFQQTNLFRVIPRRSCTITEKCCID